VSKPRYILPAAGLALVAVAAGVLLSRASNRKDVTWVARQQAMEMLGERIAKPQPKTLGD
jgi:hypothetical protein